MDLATLNLIIAGLTLLIAVATLAIAWFSHKVSPRVKDLEQQYSKSRNRATTVWHLLDNSMRHGYKLQDNFRNGRAPTNTDEQIKQAWEWIERFGVLSYDALGYHAYRVVFMNYWSKERLTQKVQEGATVPSAFQLVLNNVYDHNIDKVADGKFGASSTWHFGRRTGRQPWMSLVE